MARKDPASLVGGAGLLTGIFTKLNDEVESCGGTAEHLHWLTKPEADATIQMMARLIVDGGGGILVKPIDFLGLNVKYEPSLRAYNSLVRVGIETIGDLVTKSASELQAIPNFGKKSLEIVREKLAEHGLALKDDEPPAESPHAPEPQLDAKSAIDKLFELCKLLDVKIDLTHKIAEHREMEKRWEAEEAPGSYGGELAGPEMKAGHRKDAEKLSDELSDASAEINVVVSKLAGLIADGDLGPVA